MPLSRAEKIFTRIYAANSWGDPESKSGTGSGIARTELLRSGLTRLLRDMGVRSILDVPCGDFNWMRLTELPGIEYTGADIVGPLVERNNSLYAQSSRKFLYLDMVRDPLPQADLIFCRDGLVHLSFLDITQTLKKMNASGATYLLVTTFTEHLRNRDIATGAWRPLNLLLAPFCFPPPLQTLADGPRPDGTFPDKILALYRFADLSPCLPDLQRRARKMVVPEALRRGLSALKRFCWR